MIYALIKDVDPGRDVDIGLYMYLISADAELYLYLRKLGNVSKRFY